MKKSIVSALLIFCMAISLMGCQKKYNGPDNAEQITETTEVVDGEDSMFTEPEEWQITYCKILLGILGRMENMVEYFGEDGQYFGETLSDGTIRGGSFELMDVDEDGTPELFVGDTVIFPNGESCPCVSGINADTNQLILYEDYNTSEPMYVANVTNSKLDVEFVIWHEDWSAWKKAYNVEYGNYSEDSGADISEQEYNQLSKKHESNLYLPKGVELTLDNIEKYLNIQFDAYDKEFVNLLLQNEKSFDLKYDRIYFDDDNIPDYVLNVQDGHLEIYIHDGEKFHIIGDGDSDKEKIIDWLIYGIKHHSYYYYEKKGILEHYTWDESNLQGTPCQIVYETFYKLNSDYELEYDFSTTAEYAYSEDGEDLEGTYYYEDNYGEEKQECSEETYEAKITPLGTAKDLTYDGDMSYTNLIDLVVENIRAKKADNTISKDENTETESIEDAYKEAKIVVSQIDVSKYPTVNVYFHLEDLNGNYLENIDYGNNKIQIKESNGNGTSAMIVQADAIKQKNISFVIDISGNMVDYDKYIYIQSAINTLLDDMQNQGDYAASLLAFNDTQNLLEDFSSDYTNLRSELAGVTPNGGTAFWDSLELALIKANMQLGQKCIIAATDGLDNSSRTTKEDVIALSKQLQIPIYVIAFDEATANEMGAFAQNTGGACFTINDINNLKMIYQSIFTRQENQMMFTFVSDGNTGEADRGLELELKAGGYKAETNIQYHTISELYANAVTNDIVVSVEASSHLEEYYQSTGHLYHIAENVLDGSYRTAWVENAPGNGVGEWIQMNFDGSYAINGIEISNGYKKSESLYEKNSRAKRIRLLFSNGSSQEFELVDEFMGIQRLQFAKPVVTNSIRIELLEMYPGTKYEDTCITELRVY